MKTALITGDRGFVGRHMVRALTDAGGWEVVGIDLDPRNDTDALGYFRHGRYVFDLVVHCAASGPNRVQIDNKSEMHFARNLQLDSAMFEWATRTTQRRVVYFSSSAVYPADLQDVPDFRLAEFDTTPGKYNNNPADDYGWTKLIGERLAQTARDNGVPTTVVRPFSGYGEDQSLDFPFPAILQRAKAGEVSVWGPPGQTRDWIHIDDITAGVLALVHNGVDGPVNLCTGVATEMGELALMAFRGFHPTGRTPAVHYDTSKPTGVFYRVGSPLMLQQWYTPRVSIEGGIRRAIRANS